MIYSRALPIVMCNEHSWQFLQQPECFGVAMPTAFAAKKIRQLCLQSLDGLETCIIVDTRYATIAPGKIPTARLGAEQVGTLCPDNLLGKDLWV